MGYRLLYISLFLLLSSPLNAGETLTLDSALSKALATHPEVRAARASLDAENSAISFSQWPSDPMFGVMYEQNQNFMQQQLGPMTSLVFSQDIEFPAKYYFRGRVQESRASQAKEAIAQSQLLLRRKVITTYFQLYANQHIQDLVEAQRDIVRQTARIAESRHSVGAVTQQDEMKAHVEQTAVENEAFELRREGEALQAKLALLLSADPREKFALPKDGFSVPEEKQPDDILDVVLQHSSRIRQNSILVDEAKHQKTLALFDYAPDFRLSARTMVGANSPANNFAFSVDLTIPLWFFMRQNSEVSTASSRAREAQFKLESTKRELFADAQEIAAKIKTHHNLIKIFSSTLIPQAQSTANASRAAYQAGRSSFLELLDSVRTVYTVQVAYYRHIAEYVEQLVILEELAGTSLSTLPFGESR